MAQFSGQSSPSPTPQLHDALAVNNLIRETIRELLPDAIAALGLGQLVAALPAAPVNGQNVVYAADQANGVLWNLRYNAGSPSAFKWEFVGGAELDNSIITTEAAPSSGAYIDLATIGPSITVPLPGDYMVRFGASFGISAANAVADVGVKVGAAAVNNDLSITFANPSNANSASVPLVPGARSVPIAGIAAADVVKLQYRASTVAAGANQFRRRWLSIVPIRVA